MCSYSFGVGGGSGRRPLLISKAWRTRQLFRWPRGGRSGGRGGTRGERALPRRQQSCGRGSNNSNSGSSTRPPLKERPRPIAVSTQPPPRRHKPMQDQVREGKSNSECLELFGQSVSRFGSKQNRNCSSISLIRSSNYGGLRPGR